MIRDQRPGDAPAVHRLLRSAFGEEPEVADLEAALADRPDSVGFVSDEAGVVVGHVRLTRGWVDAPQALVPVLVLSPLAVRPDHQGRGLGRALVAHALAHADARGEAAVFLEGDPAYYSRLGWRPAGEIGVTAPSERIPDAACQVVTLLGYEPWMRGRLVYADTFWSYDCVGLRGEALRRFSD